MQTRFNLGIDIAKAKFDASLILPEGKVRSHANVANTLVGADNLLVWLKKQGVEDLAEVHVCMEATNVYWEDLAAFLAEAGCMVSVVNPAQIKAYGRSRLTRSKTDKIDAQLIALYCKEHHPLAWQAPSAVEKRLRALVDRREALSKTHTQEANRSQTASPAVKADIKQHLAWLEKHIQQIEKEIHKTIHSDPDLKKRAKLLDSIPGLGDVSISVILAYRMTPEHFDNARQAAAYAGLDPRQHQSGSSVHGKPRMSKIGHGFLRKTFYMPALAAVRRSAWGRTFFERLLSRGKLKMTAIGAMMRKLVHVAFGVLKSGRPFDPALHATAPA
jgi:transposase